MKTKTSKNFDEKVPVSIITREDGATIAYDYIKGKSPGIIFLAGLKSDMLGTKAEALRRYAIQCGQGFLRFDYTGHGRSSGNFNDGNIGDWTKDALLVLDKLTTGPQILVGSSMGGWIMLLVALQRKKRIAGFIGLAAAPDFTESLIWNELNRLQRLEMTNIGYIHLPNCYEPGRPYRISHQLVIEGRNHLLLNKQIPLAVPVRLFHGMNDVDVPYKTSIILSEKLQSDDVSLTLIKSGDHRLSREEDLKVLVDSLDQLKNKIVTQSSLK